MKHPCFTTGRSGRSGTSSGSCAPNWPTSSTWSSSEATRPSIRAKGTTRSDGTYDYVARPGTNRYGARITWEMSARYCNWLHNGKLNEPWAFETGAYDTSTFYRNEQGVFQHRVEHLPGAKFWIPSLDEWTKAVYYDPNRYGEGQEGYWQNPNMTDDPLRMGLPEDGGETIGDLLWQEEFRELGAWDLGQYPTVTTPWGLIDVSAAVADYLSTRDATSTGLVQIGGSTAGVTAYGAFDRIDVRSVSLVWETFDGGLRVATIPTVGVVQAFWGFTAVLLVRRRKRG